ncbi:MAG: diacylglyceryl transferase [Flavobacteriaceae bacterium]|nr:MAG: diacylglyceryl transferase [Flavobacteriaceae bacterium]
MEIPFEPILLGRTLNIHLIFEYLAFFVAYRYYRFLKKNQIDAIGELNRLSIIIGAIFGAFIGSRVIGFLENPLFLKFEGLTTIIQLFNLKTIMGGLFGGLLGVELSKKVIGEKQSSGDLFTFPIILGIMIGRIGCFLYGINEFTYGIETSFFTGIDIGDGLLRHPIALYEIVFLAFLMYLLRKISYKKLPAGGLFKLFMIFYFGFRFFIEFLKPNVFYVLGISSIQFLCILCWFYYLTTIKKIVNYARKRLYLL